LKILLSVLFYTFLVGTPAFLVGYLIIIPLVSKVRQYWPLLKLDLGVALERLPRPSIEWYGIKAILDLFSDDDDEK